MNSARSGLGLTDRPEGVLAIDYAGSGERRSLLEYVYRPTEAQVESPRPYFHPIRTLGGDPVSLYRPHDHVWHKGLSMALPNVGEANFWGGPTYKRDRQYVWLPNNGTTRHDSFERLEADPDRVRIVERLSWLTQAGELWFTEHRSIEVLVGEDAWTLLFRTAFTNVGDSEVAFGSPTTEGRENAGYGGLFWRGPRSFSGGRVYTPQKQGGDELMGIRAPWLAYAGQHDGHGRWSSLVFVSGPADESDGSPGTSSGGQEPDGTVQWFVRTGIYACLCPAPFFSAEVPVAPGETLAYRYAVSVADGDCGPEGAARLADAGRAALTEAPGVG